MSAGVFALPSAWRGADGEGSEPGAGGEGRKGHRVEVPFGDLTDALAALATGAGAEPAAVPAAAHVKVLSQLVEEPEFAVDVRRPSAGIHGLAVAPGTARTWRELVRQVAAALHEAAAEEPGRASASGSDVLLSTAGAEAPDADGPEPGYGLSVVVHDDTVTLQAGPFLGAEHLERLAAMYRGVLEAMASSPEGDAATAILPSAEREAVLRGWALGPSREERGGSVLELFRAQAAATAEATAVEAEGRTLSYRELDLRSDRIARLLLERGARPDAPVGVCLRRGLDLLPTLLGVWKAGSHYLPLDVEVPAARLRQMVAASGCPLVISVSAHLPLLETFEGVELVLLDAEREAPDARETTPVGTVPDPDALAYVIYTSGSTGAPKGVMVHHRGLANYIRWTAREYAGRGGGGSPHFSSIGFDLGVPSLFAPLVVGQRVHLLPDPFELADLGALLAEGAPYSFIKMTPGHLNLLATDLEPEQAHGLAGLVIAAGDAFPAQLARRWQTLAGPGGTRVATEYGPTEITVGNSGREIGRVPADGLIPLGAPIPDTSMYVLDHRLEPVAEGVPGEVCVGGAGVAHGYLGAPALTAERFLPDPYGPPGSRLYRTGDRGRWRDGELEFLGRTDHQVKIRGYRVEPGEVCAVLRRRPDVQEAVVIACDAGSGRQRLVGFVVPAPDTTPDLPAVRADLLAELPEYLVPAELLAIGEIPLTANGKVDTRALQARL